MVETDKSIVTPAVTHLQVIRYWRDCVADTAMGRARFSKGDLERILIRLSEGELTCGRANSPTVKHIFKNQDKNIEHMSVRLWPLLTTRRKSHATERFDGLPEYVAPIVTEAQVARSDGCIWPRRTVIPRDILEPLPEGAFSVGTIEDLDSFLTRNPFSAPHNDESHDCVWEMYRDYCKQLRNEVAGGWPREKDEYERTGKGIGLIEVAGNTSATIRGILALYDNILKSTPKSLLLESYAITKPKPTIPVLDSPHDFAQRLGHATNAFSLAEKQREVLAHLSVAEDGEIQAVNGPPGTGKTTMLLSAIAGEWVRAALNDGHPPVIAAASTNNQAVTNIIDAFAKDFARGDGHFAGRWLPNIESFGLYLPAWSNEGKAAKKYQTESFFARLETEKYVQSAMDEYLTSAERALPELKAPDLKNIVCKLHERIVNETRKLETADATLKKLEAALADVERLLGNEPEKALTLLEAGKDRRAKEDADSQRLLYEWEKFLAGESIFLSLFSFLPPVARKRRLRARILLREFRYDKDVETRFDVDAIESDLRHRLDASRERLQKAKTEWTEGQKALSALTQAQKNRTVAIKNIGTSAADTDDVVAQDRMADCKIRFDLFLLATHYWEGRWLLEMEKLLPLIDKEKNKKGKKVVVTRWRRRMMLTPCMVSTFATLPGKMTFSRFVDERFYDDYLLNFIDLLIVDEAGQVLPEVAGASFALAKKALVIGDTRQIEPISSLAGSVDIGNLVANDVLSIDQTEEDVERIKELGVTSTGGSAMHVAQSACRYHPHSELDRGLYLFEHRRCYDEIVKYCNALCYKGKLEPCRGLARDNDSPAAAAGLNPFAYLQVDGVCKTSGGSRSNRVEALTIAAWLSGQRETLETGYGKKLEEIVGVVTPFGLQVREIRGACRDKNIPVDGSEGMSVGTIHSLQGTDREVVIFSPTYSKQENGGFIDRSPSMLNVAVSRAKDCFLVIGDMDLFSTAKDDSPRRLLADFLFEFSGNALELDTLP